MVEINSSLCYGQKMRIVSDNAPDGFPITDYGYKIGDVLIFQELFKKDGTDFLVCCDPNDCRKDITFTADELELVDG